MQKSWKKTEKVTRTKSELLKMDSILDTEAFIAKNKLSD